jgi:23S rRNA pseudouridine1911/1915/1917 synthase
MLHAWQLAVDHPRDGRRLRFEARIPAEFTPWLQSLDLRGLEVG